MTEKTGAALLFSSEKDRRRREIGHELYATALYFLVGRYIFLMLIPFTASIRVDLRFGTVALLFEILALIWLGRARKMKTASASLMFWAVFIAVAEPIIALLALTVGRATQVSEAPPYLWEMFVAVRHALTAALLALLAWRIDVRWFRITLLLVVALSILPAAISVARFGPVSPAPERPYFLGQDTVYHAVSWGLAALAAAYAGWLTRKAGTPVWLVPMERIQKKSP